MVNVVAVPLDGLTGVTVITGVMVSDQLASVPVVPVLELVSWSVQVAFGVLAVGAGRARPATLGLNVPVNGACARCDRDLGRMSKMVLVKLEPVPPTPENKRIWVPSGAIKTALSAESVGKATLSWTVTLATWNVSLKLGTVKVASRALGAGQRRGGNRLGDAGRIVLRAGDQADRAHDPKHVVGGEGADRMGRSKVTLIALLVPLRTRLSKPEPPDTEVLTTCGPGTIRGSVSESNGGRRMESAGIEESRDPGFGHRRRVGIARRQASVGTRQRVLARSPVGVLIHRIAELGERAIWIRFPDPVDDRGRDDVTVGAGVVGDTAGRAVGALIGVESDHLVLNVDHSQRDERAAVGRVVVEYLHVGRAEARWIN